MLLLYITPFPHVTIVQTNKINVIKINQLTEIATEQKWSGTVPDSLLYLLIGTMNLGYTQAYRQHASDISLACCLYACV